MENSKAVEVFGITKRFGTAVAVDNISFDVAEGELFGFLGPNGAGKTTLIRMLTTLLSPTGGSARVGCCDITKDPDAVRRSIGVVPQAMTSDLDLTGYENMDIYGKFYGMSTNERRERIDYLMEMVGLKSRGKDLVATYSGGMRRRLEVARALVHRPKILFLDEPTVGLDPQSRLVVWDILGKLRKNTVMTVFLTTHYLEEAEALCNRVAIIDAGKIIAMGSPSELKSQVPGKDIVTLVLENLPAPFIDKIKGLPFVHQINTENHTLRINVESGAQNLLVLIDEARTSGVKVLSATIHEQTLEDVFIHYTGKSIREEEGKKISFLVGAGAPQR